MVQFLAMKTDFAFLIVLLRLELHTGILLSERTVNLSLHSIGLTRSSIYGDNEIMLGDWFQRTGKRDEIFLSSKFGIIMDVESFAFKGINSSAKSCRNACEESLKKMGIDHIDLCKFLHVR